MTPDLNQLAASAAEHCWGVAALVGSNIVGGSDGRKKMNEYILSALTQAVEQSKSDEGQLECGHNAYWRTVYDTCMACRAEKAEKQLQQVEAERDAYKSRLDQLHGLREVAVKLVKIL